MIKFLERFGGVALATVFLATALLLSSCEQGEKVVPTFDRSGLVMSVQINVYDTLGEVEEVYRQVHDLHRTQELAGLQGFAVWYEYPNGKPNDEPYECTIHVARPGRVDDNNTLTLGHEMLHCIYGSYHKQKH